MAELYERDTDASAAAYDDDYDDVTEDYADRLPRSTAPAPSSRASPYRRLSTPSPTATSPPAERIPPVVAATYDLALLPATNVDHNDATTSPAPGDVVEEDGAVAGTDAELPRWASLTPSPPPRTQPTATGTTRAREDDEEGGLSIHLAAKEALAGLRAELPRWASLTPSPPPGNLPMPTGAKRAHEDTADDDDGVPMSDADLPRATKRRRVYMDTASGSQSQADARSTTTATQNTVAKYTTAASAAVVTFQGVNEESDEDAKPQVGPSRIREQTPGLRRSKRDKKPRERSVQAVSVHPSPRGPQPVPRPRRRGKAAAAQQPLRVTAVFEMGRDPVEVKREEEDDVLLLLSEDSAEQGLADDEAVVAGPSRQPAAKRAKVKAATKGRANRPAKKDKGKRGGR